MKLAAITAIIIGILLFFAKFVAYRLTDSQAIFSDALESIVNILTAIVSYKVIVYASLPADEDHPYGHGKMEYISAGLEGGLIAFAAVMIAVQAIQALIEGAEVKTLGLGLVIIGVAGIVNLVLGQYLKSVGKKQNSVALEASGRHLLTDFWTSAGIIGGLVVVMLTNIWWLDPLIALLVGGHLASEGYSLTRKALAGLLDEEETATIERLQQLIGKNPQEGIIQVHHMRVMRSGRFHHIDAHVVVPEFWTVEEAHDQTLAYERKIIADYEFAGEFHFHIDPCRRLYCQYCDVKNCPVRKEPFRKRRVESISELTDTNEPF